MEILFVSHKYPPVTGGMEKQSFELIKGMERYATVHKIVYTGAESRITFFRNLSKRINQALKQHPNIKCIHFNDALLGVFCSFHNSYRHIPLIVTIHGLDVSFPSNFYKKHLLSRLNRFSKIIAVSEATAQAAVKNGLQSEKVVVVPNGVDITESNPISAEEFKQKVNLPDKKILLMLGRPVQRKGFSWFISHVLPKLEDDFQVVMVGPFKKEPDFAEKLLFALPAGLSKRIMLFLGYPSDERQLRNLQSENVHHLGHQPYSVIQALFQHSHAFLMPNIAVEGDMEGFGLVCLEASINGSLVLAANIDGIPSAIQHQKNGILIDSGNVDAWVENIEAYRSPLLKEQFKEFTINHYPWNTMVQGYLKVFNTAK